MCAVTIDTGSELYAIIKRNYELIVYCSILDMTVVQKNKQCRFIPSILTLISSVFIPSNKYLINS